MKKIILAAVLACLSLAAPVWADEPAEMFLDFRDLLNNMELAQQLEERDLHGAWMAGHRKANDDITLKIMILSPNHTGEVTVVDIIGGKLVNLLNQKIKWHFNPKTQMLVQSDNSASDMSVPLKAVGLTKIKGKTFSVTFYDGREETFYLKQNEEEIEQNKEMILKYLNHSRQNKD